MPRAKDKGETTEVVTACSYGGDEHSGGAKFPRCANCGEDAGCSRCRQQEIVLKCKHCGTLWNGFPWWRERLTARKEHNRLALAGTTRFTPSGFPMIVEGDGWLRAVRIDAVPLKRRITVDARGAYLDQDGNPFVPEEWDRSMFV
jgi:predicted RNA-binding Zn-ribbon protein involved in translation (DUF1610 family)